MRLHGCSWTKLIIVLAACLCLRCLPAAATPTSLNVIPTADVLPNGEATGGFQLQGGPSGGSYHFINQFQTQLGWGGDIEFGMDPPLGPNKGNSVNVKYRFYQETERRPEVAAGIYTDLGTFGNPIYVVGLKSIGNSRIHFGSTTLSHSIRAMAGYDLAPKGPLTLQADYTSGPKAYASLGVVFNLKNGISINVAQLFGNSSSTPNAYLVNISWTCQVLKD